MPEVEGSSPFISTKEIKGLQAIDCNPFRCVPGMAQNLWGVSPLPALIAGTASQEQGRRREAGSEGSWRQKSDSTDRNRI